MKSHPTIPVFTSLCVALSCVWGFADPVAEHEKAPPPLKSIRIATYNVEFGANATAEQIGEMLKLYQLDVIGLSEAPDGDWGPRMGKVLGMEFCYVGKISSANHKDKFKIILSRTPLEDPREVAIPGAGWSPASAVRAVSTIRGIRCAIYSLHICGSKDKAGQAVHLADKVLPQEKEPRVIVVGDFNNQMTEFPMQYLKEKGMTASWENLKIDLAKEYTWNAKNPKEREGVIDHILYNQSSGAAATAGGIIELEKPLSDHKPVWAEIQFK